MTQESPSALWFAQSQPVLLRRLSGGWLAVTQADLPVRVGVEAESPEEAQEKFRGALDAWRRLWTDATINV